MSQTNPVIECLMNHRSVRKFKPEPIPEETIEMILRAGTRAATAGGIQPYGFIVIDDPVQQMDDLNAASFIDLIREVSIQNRRQFVITTCNDEFYRLALSKLSCLNTKKVTQFRAYRLEGLRQEGPEIIIDAPYWANEETKVV